MTPDRLREVLTEARKAGWRPLYPRNRRDGQYAWASQPRVRGSRRFPTGTGNIIVDVAGTRVRVDIRVLRDDVWVGVAHFDAPGDIAVNILVDFGYLPPHLHSGWHAYNERVAEAKRRMFARLIANAPRLDTPFTDEPSLSPWDLLKADMARLEEALKEATT